jgi:DNA-binding NarL/FixJ family response regulator
MVAGASVAREMQQLLLQQAGCSVTLFDHPHAALALAGQQHFDFAVFDCELPDMTSEQFVLSLQAVRPEITIILMADALPHEVIARLTRHGVAGVFSKTSHPAALVGGICDLLLRIALPAGRDSSLPPFSSGMTAGASRRPSSPEAPGAARVAATRSLFRPASRAYNFGKRLSESLALAAAS